MVAGEVVGLTFEDVSKPAEPLAMLGNLQLLLLETSFLFKLSTTTTKIRLLSSAKAGCALIGRTILMPVTSHALLASDWSNLNLMAGKRSKAADDPEIF